MTKSFKIITLGCKVNQYESACLAESLSNAGWYRVLGKEKADVSIINSCIVTQAASRQSRQEIRKAIKKNPDSIVVATGCYSQVFPEELLKIDGLGLIVGNREKSKLPGILLQKNKLSTPKTLSNAFEKNTPFDFLPIRRFAGRSRAFLKIQDGCESSCSYCIVPAARGPYRSLSPEIVLSTVASLAEQGYQEIVLTGIHLGKYGIDSAKKFSLMHLLTAILEEGLPVRIRLSSLEINEIDTELIDMVATESRLCRHFHIPLQSGDDAVLKSMNRNYSRTEFARLIQIIREKIPFAAIGTDILSGFPGEGSLAHQNTCALLNDLPISYAHVFPYSARPGTPAAEFKGRVGAKTSKCRAAELRNIALIKKKNFFEQCLEKSFAVLPEGWHSRAEMIMKGKTDNYIPVLFSSKIKKKQILPINLEKVDGNYVRGSII